MKESLLVEDIIRSTVGKWDHENYVACENLSNTIHSEGWEILQSLWKDLEESIWQRIQRECDGENKKDVLRLIGIMEGVKLAIRIPDKVFIEREEQRKAAEREAKDIARKGEQYANQELEDGA